MIDALLAAVGMVVAGLLVGITWGDRDVWTAPLSAAAVGAMILAVAAISLRLGWIVLRGGIVP